MQFQPADHFLGPDQTYFTIELTEHAALPDGTYTIVDLYCGDPECDCRKVIFTVLHDNKAVGAIDFGWESLKFYTKWNRGDKEFAREMKGWSTNPLCDYKLNPNDLIDLLREFMDDEWLATIKDTYKEVRKTLKIQNQVEPLHSAASPPTRNAPCPCGSGKKYKRCCIDKPSDDSDQNMISFPFK